ncbi:tyrosine-type recombinase/integrase [Tateyamaria sp.]|uniref:tyrosine-type recombinase/integrase n=1 Tax=Tateyamaria sp. TaxID=1929288 RepID=UPI00329C4F6C
MRVGTLNKLNAKAARSAKDGMHSDGGGLFLQVKGNARSWVFRFTIEGMHREMGLGSASNVTLATARTKAAEGRDKVGAGINPLSEVRAEPEHTPEVRTVPTFEHAMHNYITTHRATRSNAKHGAQWESSLFRYAGPLMRRPVDQITTANVEDCLAPIWLTKCETASRVRQRIERILSATIARGDRAGPNPAGWRDNLEHILPAQKKVRTVKHHAAMSVEEVPSAFKCIFAKRHAGIGYAGLVTLFLTACRSGEVRHMQWDDLTGADTLVLPAGRMIGCL